MTREYPEKLLGVAEIVFLSGFHKNTILKELKDATSVLCQGRKIVLGEYRVPVSVYNAWVNQGRPGGT